MNELENNENVNEDLQISDNTTKITEPTQEEESKSESIESAANEEVDYAEIIKADTEALKARFPELSKISDVTELDNPLRYAALRDLGLTPEEAYLATRKRRMSDNRSHLYPSPSVSKSESETMPESEMRSARELFSGLSDSEIRKLYRKVTK
jgi:hypothetical protein